MSTLIQEKMEERFRWKTNVCNNIDWAVHRSNLVRFPFYKYGFTVKFIHEREPFQGKKSTPAYPKQIWCVKYGRRLQHTFHNA